MGSAKPPANSVVSTDQREQEAYHIRHRVHRRRSLQCNAIIRPATVTLPATMHPGTDPSHRATHPAAGGPARQGRIAPRENMMLMSTRRFVDTQMKTFRRARPAGGRPTAPVHYPIPSRSLRHLMHVRMCLCMLDLDTKGRSQESQRNGTRPWSRKYRKQISSLM